MPPRRRSRSLAARAGSHLAGLFDDVSAFRSEFKLLTVGVFATIFTWGLVQAIKRTVLAPVIHAYIIPARTQELKVDLKKGQQLDGGDLLAEFIIWIILMLVLFGIWRLTRTKPGNTAPAVDEAGAAAVMASAATDNTPTSSALAASS